MWDEVQELLAENHHSRANRNRSTVPGFLKGVVRCAHCQSSMTMSYARKKPGLPTHRYYRCSTGIKVGPEHCPLTQVPAGDLEREALAQLRRILRTPGVLAATSAEAISIGKADGIQLNHHAVVEAIHHLDEVWEELYPSEQERIVERLVDRLEVGLDHSTLRLRLDAVAGLAAELRGLKNVEFVQGAAVIRLAIRARRRCGRTRLIAPPKPEATQPPTLEPDALVLAIARAFRWQEQIESGKVPSVSALAEREDVDEAYVRRQLRLTLFPPDIISRLVSGGDGMSSIHDAVHKAPEEIWF